MSTAPRTSTDGAARPRLRVLTANVLGPANAAWEDRLPVLSRELRRAQPDVAALQEVPARDPGVVTELLGDGYHVTPFSRTADDGVGGALATRWPHEVLTEIDQRDPARPDDLPWATTLLVRVATPVGEVLVAHHKPSWPFPWEAARERQALAAARAVEDHVGPAHAVLLGDFDGTPDSSALLFLRGRRAVDGFSVCYQDAWETVHPGDPGFTFDAVNPLVRRGEVATALTRRIDYVLVRSHAHGPTLQVVSCERLFTAPEDGVWASDHFGVVAELAQPEHPPGSWGTPVPP
jgi:endonuclease/exonuclease/phosphatase family metal-dependent hydrolase